MSLFLEHAGIEVPIIGGPMYPCSNPELIAAVSNAGGIGIVQPITLTYVHKLGLREGIRFIRTFTNKPIGFNALIEKSSSKYEAKMKAWVDIALEEGILFFITSLGNPQWVVDKVHACGGVVYHDVTELKWAKIALRANVDGLIAVNNEAGGHSGVHSAKELLQLLGSCDLPIICAGGIGSAQQYKEVLELGYSGVQMGTRFIATHECSVSNAYKEAIVLARGEDITLTKALTGVPVSVIELQRDRKKNQSIIFEWSMRHTWSKKILRIALVLRSIWRLKKSMTASKSTAVVWQAGKSVETITEIKSVQAIFDIFTK